MSESGQEKMVKMVLGGGGWCVDLSDWPSVSSDQSVIPEGSDALI